MDIILFFRVMAHTSNPCCGNHGLQDNNRVGPALRYVNYFRNVCFFILFLNKSSMELALFSYIISFFLCLSGFHVICESSFAGGVCWFL